MLSLGMKSFLVSMVTGTTSQVATISTLYLTKNKIAALFVLKICGSLLAYSAQSYVFGVKGGVFGPVLLRWIVGVTMTLFLSYKMVVYVGNLEKVKKTSDRLEGNYKFIFDYASIMFPVLVGFLIWEFPMRKFYIFNDNVNTNGYALLILSVVATFVAYDQKMLAESLSS